jgi:hypothetical protein
MLYNIKITKSEIDTVWFVKIITQGVTEMSFLVLKRVNGNSEEN